jgi:hypothetical protein
MEDADRQSFLIVIITSAATTTIPFLQARVESDNSATVTNGHEPGPVCQLRCIGSICKKKYCSTYVWPSQRKRRSKRI